jgi:hypothetical protein
MTRDARHRAAFFELAEAAVAARRAGDPDEAARIGAQADAYRRPSACGHWRSQTMGADCGLRRTRVSGR